MYLKDAGAAEGKDKFGFTLGSMGIEGRRNYHKGGYTMKELIAVNSAAHKMVQMMKDRGWLVTKDADDKYSISGRGEDKATSTSFWWANQGDSYEREKNGEYIFAPLENSRGGQPSHWSNVGKVKIGDFIFHYAKGALRAASKVSEFALQTERPDDTSNGEKGLLVKTDYTELSSPLPLTGISEKLRISEKGPFNVNGAVNQGYLFPLSIKFVSELTPLLQGLGSLLDGVIVTKPGTHNWPPEKEFPLQPVYLLETCVQETALERATLERWVRAIERKGQAILYGPPGTGKTYVAERLAKHLAGGGNGFIELIQFHPTYSYEDFIQGIRPQARKDGGLDYPLVPDNSLEFCEKAKDRKGCCVLILD